MLLQMSHIVRIQRTLSSKSEIFLLNHFISADNSWSHSVLKGKKRKKEKHVMVRFASY